MNEQAFEAIMEAVCDRCHWTYVATDQEEMDTLCENCPAEKKIRAVMEGL